MLLIEVESSCFLEEHLTKKNQTDNKYFLTEWRKTPTHNYGFILDGGVHHTAALRMLLGPDDKPVRVNGFSSLAQSHLAPVDTLSAAVQTARGAVGSFSCSWGTTLPRVASYQVACERGSVTIEGDAGIVVDAEGRATTQEFPFTQGAGVMEEVAAWAAALAEDAGGREHPLLTPEITLGDLELLEAMLKSADDGGVPKTLNLQ